jgi:glycosyltransferase involved in cell wall biosynthesis
LNIAIVTHNYPTLNDPSRGIFLQKEAHLVREFSNVSVVIPNVFSTFINKQYTRTKDIVSEPFQIQKFQYLSFPRRSFPKITQWSLSKALLTVLKKHSFDIIHLHALFPCGMAAKTLKQAGHRVVITVHGGDWYSNLNNQNLMTIIEESMLFCDKVITVGKKLEEDIIKKFPSLKNKVQHIPHDINTTKFIPSVSRSTALEKLNWDTTKLHLLTVANLYKVKGIDLLIEAISKLEFEEKPRLHIISPRYDLSYKNEIESLIRQLNLQEQVTFHPSMPEDKLISYYHAADLYISPSRKEGFGLAMAEAAACGVPVLATKSGGAEQIINNKNGILIKAHSSKSITNGIIDILKKLEYYNPSEMHSDISNRFSKRQKANALQEVYTQVLKQ